MKNNDPEWQREYFGRHTQLVPAEFAYGYKYAGPLSDPDRVQRAIPAECTVYTPTPFNEPAVPVPQVDLRFGRPHRWKKAVTRIRRKRPAKKSNR